MDKGHVHSKEGLLRETQGIRLLGKKEDKGSDRRGIRVVSQREKTKNEDKQITCLFRVVIFGPQSMRTFFNLLK